MSSVRRVFVTGTGRCGTKTFAAACRHLTGWTAAHESTPPGLVSPAGLEYPDRHIEVNPHLSWMLGPLMARYGTGPDVMYIHLQRQREAVVRSWMGRGRTGGPGKWTPLSCRVDARRLNDEQWEYVCGLCYDSITHTVDAAVDHAARGWTLRMESLADPAEGRAYWRSFLQAIGAEVDMDASFSEWAVKHNASKR
jgi:hypothetical protein